MQPSLFSDLNLAVIIGNYRYRIFRIWDQTLPQALFIMLNPSTADQAQDDPTLRRCVSFAKSWSCGSVSIVNLFAFRSTKPRMLRSVADPIGPENNEYIRQAIAQADLIVCAWGASIALSNRDKEATALLVGKEAYCLGYTKDGAPRHPLYVKSTTQLVRYPRNETQLRSNCRESKRKRTRDDQIDEMPDINGPVGHARSGGCQAFGDTELGTP